MHSHIYLDESGDLGWTFSHPYRNGGSSRFLTIGYLVHPLAQANIPRRLVREFYRRFDFDPRLEVKASMLKPRHKEFICLETVKMMEKHSGFVLGAITVRKEGVDKSFRKDGNRLYHFMMGASLLDHIETHETCKITRDNRSVKSASGKSCIDYLQTLMHFHRRKPTVLKDHPTNSHLDDGIIFIDWITNCVWSAYEDQDTRWRTIMGKHLKESTLFF